MQPLSTPSTTRRIKNLDAARGAAMSLVCLSHFTAVYFRHSIGGSDLPWSIGLGMIASPTFIAISGTLLGLLFVLRRESFHSMRIKLIDRSLFVLTVAHVLIACSRMTYEAHPMDALHMTFMTDAIGVCVILGSLLIGVTSRATRVMVGVGFYTLAWRLLYAWMPHDTIDLLVKDMLVGGMPVKVLGYSVPLLQWFGVYLACTAAGEYLGEMYKRARNADVERALLTGALAALALGLILRCAGWLLLIVDFDTSFAGYWNAFFSPWSKLPPSPVYTLLMGGTGILLMWAITRASHRGLMPWFVSQLATLGRCSLAAFTLQYYVYYVMLDRLPIPRSNIWPVVFGASMVLMFAFARWWDRNNYNTLLSVGLTRGVEAFKRVEATPVTPAAAATSVSNGR